MKKKTYFLVSLILLLFISSISFLIFPKKQIADESFQVQVLEHLFKPLDLSFFYLAFVSNRLDQYVITTTDKDLQKLYDTLPKSKNKEEIRQKRYLADREYIPATLEYQGKEYKAKLTVQGGISLHYLGEKKSLRVRLNDGQDAPFSGMNFVLPEDNNFIDTQISYYLSRKLNLFMPKPSFASLNLNGINLGVYTAIYDDQDNSAIELGQLSTNDLLLREEEKPQFIALGTHFLFGQSGSWKLTNDPEAKDPIPLTAIEKLKATNEFGGTDFYQKLPDIVDMDQFLKLLAHNFIMGDFHQGGDANQVLIFVKEKGRLWFVPEENSVYPVEGLKGLHYNDFYEKVLNNPQNFWKRNEILWSMVTEPDFKNRMSKFIDDIYNNIKAPVYQDEKKTFRFLAFRAKVKTQKSILLDNIDKVKNYFNEYYIESIVDQSAVTTIRVKANSYFQPFLKSINLKFSDNYQGSLKLYLDANQNGNLDPSDKLLNTSSVQNENSNIVEINKHLEFQKFVENPFNQLKPTATSSLLLVLDPVVKINSAEVKFANSITGEDLVTTTHLINGSIFDQKPPLPDFVQMEESKYVIGPGAVSVKNDVFIPEGELEIKPGTTLIIAPGKSIISQADVKAIGTKSEPIILTAQDKKTNWGSFLVIGPHKNPSQFDYVTVEYGSGINNYGYVATGALAIHFADAIISNSFFGNNGNDDGLNVKHGKAQITLSRFENNFQDAIDLDSVPEGKVESNTFNANGGDGIDTSFSRIEIINNQIHGSKDKCISVGETSDVIIRNNNLDSCDIGIAVKDGSKAEATSNTLKNNRLAITAYMKKPIYRFGGEIRLGNNELLNNNVNQEIDSNSNIQSLP